MKSPLRLCLALLAALLSISLACKALEGNVVSTPAPTLQPMVWAPAPPPDDAITAQSAAQVKQVARWGLGRVNTLEWSSDSKLLVIATSAGVGVYEAAGFTQANFIETGAAVTSLALSTTGSHLAAGLANGNILVWESGKPERLTTLEGHRRSVTGLAFSPDSTRLASASEDQTARLWQVGGSLIRTFEPHRGYGLSLAFSPDGRRLAVGSQQVGGHGEVHIGGVKIWATETGALVRAIAEDSLPISAVAFSADGQWLLGLNAVPDREAQAGLAWEAQTGELLFEFGGDSPIAGFDLSPGGQQMAVTSREGAIRLIDADSGSEIRTWQAHSGRVNHLAYASDGVRLASAGWDGKVKIWPVAGGQSVAEIGGFLTDAPVYGLAFSPRGERLASAWGASGAVRLAEVATGREIFAVTGDSGEVNDVAFSPDGARLASAAHQDGVARLWEAANGELLATFRHSDPVVAVAFSPDGARLATASWDRTARLWNLAGGEAILSLEHTRAVKSIAFSPNGAMLATGSEDGFARLWDASGGAELQSFDLGGWVDSLAFSPDGSRLAAAADNRIAIYTLDSGRQILILNHPENTSVQTIAFSPDGSLLAAGSYDDEQVYLWDTETGRTAAVLSGHTDSVWGLAFSPDGHLLATGSADGTIRLWGISP